MAFPGTYNISYYKGDTFEFDVYPKNSSGTAFDLAGYATESAIFTIAAARGKSSVVKTGLVATVSASADKRKIVLTTGTTAGLKVGLLLTQTEGAGALGAACRITSIVSSTELTVSVDHATTGSVTFEADERYTGYATIISDHIRCAIRPDDAKLLDATKTYVYDVQISDSATPYPYVYTLLNGTISITEEVTLVGVQ